MGKADDQIDQLYQLPPDEFTAARNALAKERGDAAIKKLEKPVLAAWAVNQLYWHERKLYDEVIKTSGQVRTAHQQMLAGRPSDVKAAEAFHAEAMRRAKAAIRQFIEAAGNTASDAVMTPVTETLDALPTTDHPGRFTKPFRRSGFEALHGVTIAAAPRPKVVKPPADESSFAKASEDQQQLAMAKERLRFAEAAEREAEGVVDRARRALERAERTRERLEKELEEAVAAEKLAAKELSAGESAYAKAQADRQKLKKRAGG